MKTRFTNTEISLIKRWAKDACISPNYVTLYNRDNKRYTGDYILMISDQEKYSTMTFLNPEHELFDTIALTRQLSTIFKIPVAIKIQ